MKDIKAMFHQVGVSDEHVDYLRFLWWPQGNLEKDLEEHRMTVHLFGAVSSPSVACYALRPLMTIVLTFHQRLSKRSRETFIWTIC